MQSPLVLLVALCVLAPGLCDSMSDRCELRKQLELLTQSLTPPKPAAVTERLLATVVCEVESFLSSSGGERARREAGRGGRGGQKDWSKEEDRGNRTGQVKSRQEQSSEESSEEMGGGSSLTLSDCVGVAGGSVTVDTACFRLIFMSVYRHASSGCKMVDSAIFFQNCSEPSP